MPPDAAARLARDGYVVLPPDRRTARWAAAAQAAARPLIDAPERRGEARRCGGTWLAGVDLLPNDGDGAVAGVPLAGPGPDLVAALGLWPEAWHRAQVSVTWPGYPRPDAGESAGAARYRRRRDAAHVDGLLPEGPDRRRHLREPHAFVLGLPLTPAHPDAAPLVVWPGSHRRLGAAFAAARAAAPGLPLGEIDLTDIYTATRREVFDTCPRVPVPAPPGAAIVLHRHMLHGIAPWTAPPDAAWRAVAYFRPELTDPEAWAAPDPVPGAAAAPASGRAG
jgi:hypothetical protein